VGAKQVGHAVGLGIALTLLVHVCASAAPLCIDENIELILDGAAAEDGSFTFAVLGDSQSVDIVYLPLLNQILEDNPAFILHTGDLTFSGSAREFEHYEDILRDYPIPIVHVIGNHDIIKDKANYYRYVGDYNWCFDFGGCRFIGLDNSSGAFLPEGIEFAYNALDPGAPIFVAFHHPPAIKKWQMHAMVADEDGGNGDQMLHILEDASVTAVFSGHLHLHDKYIINGIPYIISGCGGARIYKFGFGVTEYGYVIVSVDKFGKDINYRWVPLRDYPFN
jgi:3',5'-cyclic AMP phosphodiesterase CpdA